VSANLQPELGRLGGVQRRDDELQIRYAVVAGLLNAGWGRSRIAKRFGVSAERVSNWIRIAKKRGLKIEAAQAALERLDSEALPEAVDGLMHLLKRRVPDAIFKTIDGRGGFPAAHRADGVGVAVGAAASVNFTLNIVPPAQPRDTALDGEIVGRPLE